MRELMDIVTITCVGLLVGTEFAVSAFINPILRKLGPREEMRVMPLFGETLGRVMPFWYIGSFLLLLAEMAIRYRDDGVAFLIAASAIWAVVIVLSIFVLVPINNRLVRMGADTPLEPALKERSRWDFIHRWRVAALTAAMVCLLLADLHVTR